MEQTTTVVCRNFFPLQTANVAYLQRKIQLSGWLIIPINPASGVPLYSVSPRLL